MKTILQKSFALATLSFLCAQPVFAMTLAEAETACKKANGHLVVTRVAPGARYVCKVGEKVVLSGTATPQAAPTPVVPRAGLTGGQRPELLWDKKASTPVTPAQPSMKPLASKITTVPAQVKVDSANAALALEMKNAGRDAPAAAAALKARGASAPEIAQILKSVYDITDPAVIARILKTVGFAAEAVASALKLVYGLGAEFVAGVLRGAGYAAELVAGALKSVYGLGAQAAATILKIAGFTVSEVGKALRDAYYLGAEAAATLLKIAGFTVSEVGKALRDAYRLGAQAAATMLKVAGFTAKQIANALQSIYGLGAEAIRTILGSVGFALHEIQDALSSLAGAIVDAAGDVVDFVTDPFSNDDPVWPGNIPTGTRAWYDTPASIRVTWNDNATGEDRYYVNVNRDNRGWVSYVLPANRTSFVLSGADPKSNYCIDIKAFKHGKGWTNPSRPIVCAAGWPTPWAGQPPAIWFAQSIGGNKLKIGWRDNTRDETGFVLYILSATGNERLQFPANTTEHILIGAVDKQKYCFFVQAYNRYPHNPSYSTLPSNTMCVTHSSEDPRNRANTPGDNVPPSGNRN